MTAQLMNALGLRAVELVHRIPHDIERWHFGLDCPGEGKCWFADREALMRDWEASTGKAYSSEQRGGE